MSGHWLALAAFFLMPGFPQAAHGSGTMCTIQVKRTGGKTQDTFSARGHRNVRGLVGESNVESQSNIVSTVVVSSGLQATIQYNGESVRVRCTAHGGSFDLDITVAFRSNQSDLIKELSTGITVSRGQSLDLGGIVEDMKGKSSELSTDGVLYEKNKVAVNEKVILTVN